MTLRLDLTDQDFFRDPAARIAELRALGSVIRIKLPIVGKVWITTTYDMAGRVLKDSGTFTLREEGGGVAGLRWWMPRTVRALANNMLTMDEPDHTRLRSIVDEAFRRRAVLEMEPRIFAIADELAANLFADGSPADLVERYARRLPFAVIYELLGLPHSDRARFMAWANAVTRFRGLLSFWRIMRVYGAMRPHFEERLQAAREQGGEGLIAELVRVEKEGGRIQQRGDGGHGLSPAWRRFGNHHASDQRIGLRAPQEPRAARLAGGRLEPGQSGDRGVLAVCFGGAVHQAALRG